jgi:hypothetical protein
MGGASLYIETCVRSRAFVSDLQRERTAKKRSAAKKKKKKTQDVIIANDGDDDDNGNDDGDDVGVDVEGGGGGSLFITGHMGEVMKESTQIAYTVAKAFFYYLADNSAMPDGVDANFCRLRE